MKKALLATSVLAMLSSGAATAATVFQNQDSLLNVGGRAQFRGDFLHDNKTMEDNSRARINVAGETKLTNELKAFGFYEAEMNASGTENRYYYAGIAGDWGALSGGKQDMASVIISDFTDITEFSGVQQVIDSSSNKQDNVIAYRGEFDNLDLQATFQGGASSDQDKYGLSGAYAFDFGLKLGAAYSAGGSDDVIGEDESQLLVGAAYTLNDLYLAGSYSTGEKNNSDFNAYEMVAQYALSDAFSIAAMYTNVEDEEDSGNIKEANGFELVGYYSLAQNVTTYVSYYSNQIDNADDTLRLGLQYNF